MARKQGRLSQHFWRSEFECKCNCGYNTVDAELIAVLEGLRWELDERPIQISSGCRCERHNKNVGGAPESQHTLGKAADITVPGVRVDVVGETLDKLYPNSYGIGYYNNWIHIDVRPIRVRWDKRG